MDKFYINSIPVYRNIQNDTISFLFFENNENGNKVTMNIGTPEDIQFQTILNIIKDITQEELTVYKEHAHI
jgi:hypothetical protein